VLPGGLFTTIDSPHALHFLSLLFSGVSSTPSDFPHFTHVSTICVMVSPCSSDTPEPQPSLVAKLTTSVVILPTREALYCSSSSRWITKEAISSLFKCVPPLQLELRTLVRLAPANR
jgi:hypothetical protein